MSVCVGDGRDAMACLGRETTMNLKEKEGNTARPEGKINKHSVEKERRRERRLVKLFRLLLYTCTYSAIPQSTNNVTRSSGARLKKTENLPCMYHSTCLLLTPQKAAKRGQ